MKVVTNALQHVWSGRDCRVTVDLCVPNLENTLETRIQLKGDAGRSLALLFLACGTGWHVFQSYVDARYSCHWWFEALWAHTMSIYNDECYYIIEFLSLRVRI
jgi:hypothetical protein